ncbi:DUF58 domain-containing protein [Actinocatenispora sera]|uniref:DUF58 domain-containing protein n=1 Tax=Actinocatenispora sera TaxID=390989 RepID=UPI00068CEBAC|nr:DUF58 domain-containing protein [Actinocatenispora sera]
MTDSPGPATSPEATVAAPVSLPVRFGRTLAAARLGVLAVAAVVVALIVDHAAALALAAPPLLLLALRSRRARPDTLTATVSLDPPRCIEGDTVTLSVRLTLPVPVDQLSVTLGDDLPVDGPNDGVAVQTASTVLRFALVPRRWARLDLGTALVTLLAPGGLDRARLRVPLGELTIYPQTAPPASPPRPARLPQLVGEHVVASTGTGVEFAGIRPYQAGDPVRLVHWASSARYGRPHVVLRHAERLADVVLMIDGYSDVGPPGGSSLDVSVRTAASLAESWLAIGDRVGVVTLSGLLRWLPVGLGRRTLYPIVDSVLSVRRDREVPIAGPPRIPLPALPPGALVVLLTPLLSDRILEVVQRLGERGMAMLVLDTLPAEPAIGAGPAGSAMGAGPAGSAMGAGPAGSAMGAGPARWVQGRRGR